MTRGVGYLAFLLASLVLASVARADDVPPEAVIATLPFDAKTEPNTIYVNVAPVESPPFVLQLDTGSEASQLTPRAARAAGVSVRRDKQDPYRHGTRLGRDVQFWVADRRSDTASTSSFEYGLLGGEFLDAYVVEIDFGARSVRFLDPSRYQVPASVQTGDEAVLPLRIDGHRPFVEVRVEGRPITLLIDTGAPIPIWISGAAAKEIDVDPESLPELGAIGIGIPAGKTGSRVAEVAAFELGGFRFGPLPVVFVPHGLYNAGGTTDSLIGYDVLSRFVVRLDYPRKRLWLRRAAEGGIPFHGIDYGPMHDDGVLLRASAPKGYQVVGVRPEGPASRLGLQPGDKLLAESPTDGHPLSLSDVMTAIGQGQHVRVARKINDTWVDLDLPDDPVLKPQTAP